MTDVAASCFGLCGRAARPIGRFCCDRCGHTDPGTPVAHDAGCRPVLVRLVVPPGDSSGDLIRRVDALLGGEFAPWTPEALQLVAATDAVTDPSESAPPDVSLTVAAALLRLFATTTVVDAPSCAY